MKILVRNLDRNVTEAELQTMFAEFGTIDSCTLVLDKETNKSKGFGFVEMSDPTEANAAISKLHHKRIGKNAIKVKLAEDK